MYFSDSFYIVAILQLEGKCPPSSGAWCVSFFCLVNTSSGMPHQVAAGSRAGLLCTIRPLLQHVDHAGQNREQARQCMRCAAVLVSNVQQLQRRGENNKVRTIVGLLEYSRKSVHALQVPYKPSYEPPTHTYLFPQLHRRCRVQLCRRHAQKPRHGRVAAQNGIVQRSAAIGVGNQSIRPLGQQADD